MNKKRPINLDLTTMHFPVMAITSIMHRLSGLVIFLLLPLMMYFLQHSLASAEAFHQLQILLTHPLNKLCLWLFSAALTYHFMAGLRHLFADMGYGEGLARAQSTAWILLALTVLSTIILGVWIW